MKKLVILDLDETLIHATALPLDIPEDFTFDRYYVYKRPYLETFLLELATDFRLGIWSSADDDYVEAIVRTITPPEINLEIVWGRSRCSCRRDMELDTYIYEKRLDKLKKRGFRLEQILMVDDTREKSRTNYGNAIPIREYTGDPGDEELRHLLAYVRSLKDCMNVRTVEKRGWRLGRI